MNSFEITEIESKFVEIVGCKSSQFYLKSAEIVSKLAIEWAKLNNITIVCLYPEDEQWGCLFYISDNEDNAIEELAPTISLAIMKSIIKANSKL